jgi:hypothetical protein
VPIINIFGIKALWILEIIFHNIFFSLFANTLAINLYMTLHILIDHYSITLDGIIFFWNQGYINLTMSFYKNQQRQVEQKIDGKY